eukprot:TRINITY_DN73333_c0_g1_i1.p1 TRINITY_DN73333_c0_g1~~TRINITY_DN73333_c0_g1_i1.p1  ORF type:complete len:234 (+),score=51.31 TRINITY_DN73333_c0_g1_i1:38-703(+)
MQLPVEEHYDHLYKLVLVGDSSVGKTCLLARYTKGSLPNKPASTIGVEFATQTVSLPGGQTAKVQIWDTAGQERYRAITTAHYRKAVGALLVYDITRIETFQNCEKWLQELKQGAGQEVVVTLVGNKLDLVNKNPAARAVGLDLADAFAQSNGLLFQESSALSPDVTEIKKLFQQLVVEVHKKAPRAATPAANNQQSQFHLGGQQSGKGQAAPMSCCNAVS